MKRRKGWEGRGGEGLGRETEKGEKKIGRRKEEEGEGEKEDKRKKKERKEGGRRCGIMHYKHRVKHLKIAWKPLCVLPELPRWLALKGQSLAFRNETII